MIGPLRRLPCRRVVLSPPPSHNVRVVKGLSTGVRLPCWGDKKNPNEGKGKLAERGNGGGPSDPEEELQARVAWYYYVGNLTQQQIATRIGSNRVRVNRLLAAGRESGLVQITINSKIASCAELEQRLIDGYGLGDAIVVPTPDRAEHADGDLPLTAGQMRRHDRAREAVEIGRAHV